MISDLAFDLATSAKPLIVSYICGCL